MKLLKCKHECMINFSTSVFCSKITDVPKKTYFIIKRHLLRRGTKTYLQVLSVNEEKHWLVRVVDNNSSLVLSAQNMQKLFFIVTVMKFKLGLHCVREGNKIFIKLKLTFNQLIFFNLGLYHDFCFFPFLIYEKQKIGDHSNTTTLESWHYLKHYLVSFCQRWH